MFGAGTSNQEATLHLQYGRGGHPFHATCVKVHEYDCLLLEFVFGNRPDDSQKVKAYVLENISSDPELQKAEILFLGSFGRACEFLTAGDAEVPPAPSQGTTFPSQDTTFPSVRRAEIHHTPSWVPPARLQLSHCKRSAEVPPAWRFNTYVVSEGFCQVPVAVSCQVFYCNEINAKPSSQSQPWLGGTVHP